ncbi:MAG: hypothetical protein V2B13_16125 [Pseudomonadota bacterium]
MKAPIKILHINAYHQVVYTIIRDGALIRSTIPIKTAVTMLENESFDLILSEPQSMAVFTSQTPSDDLEPVINSIPKIFSHACPTTLFSTYHLENKQLKPCNLN